MLFLMGPLSSVFEEVFFFPLFVFSLFIEVTTDDKFFYYYELSSFNKEDSLGDYQVES